MRVYKIVEDTGDIGVEVYGKNYKELFEKLSYAIFDLMVENSKVSEKIEEDGVLDSSDFLQMIVRFSDHLIYLFDHHKFVGKRCFVDFTKNKNDYFLKYKIYGEKIVQSRHQIKRFLKSATYHNIDYFENDGKKGIRIYFDL